MTRTIITPTSACIQVSIPKDYIGKPVEISCILVDELKEKTSPKTMSDFLGTLSDESYIELKTQTEQARKEWNRGF